MVDVAIFHCREQPQLVVMELESFFRHIFTLKIDDASRNSPTRRFSQFQHCTIGWSQLYTCIEHDIVSRPYDRSYGVIFYKTKKNQIVVYKF